MWSTDATPAHIGKNGNPDSRRHALVPPTNGTSLKIVQFPPDAQGMGRLEKATAHIIFQAIGGASGHNSNASHPLMHRNETVDYAIVLSGEIVLVLDDSEVLVRQGDVIIQQGTNHAWSNRTNQPCRIAFFMVDGHYERGLFKKLVSRP